MTEPHDGEPRAEDVASALQHGVAPSTLLEGGARPAQEDRPGQEAPRRNTPEEADRA